MRRVSLPIGIDLDITVFTQWRMKQGGDILRPFDKGEMLNVVVEIMKTLCCSYKLIRFAIDNFSTRSRIAISGDPYFRRYGETQLDKTREQSFLLLLAF